MSYLQPTEEDAKLLGDKTIFAKGNQKLIREDEKDCRLIIFGKSSFPKDELLTLPREVTQEWSSKTLDRTSYVKVTSVTRL